MGIEVVYEIFGCIFHQKCNKDFDENMLKKNLLIERTLCRDSAESKACIQNRQRVYEFEQLIQNIAGYCHKHNICYYFPKAYQHYPDMGHDVDLFIDIKGNSLKDFICNFKLTRDKSSFLNKVAGKCPYLSDYGIPVETHRFAGHFGEFKQLTQSFYDNLVVERGINQLCDEHKLLNQIVQRFYGHFTIRLSDIIHSINLLNKGVNLSFVEEEADKYGVTKALYEYLAFIFSNFERYIKSNSYLKFKKKKSKYIFFSRDVFVISKGFVLRLFLLKSLSDLMHFRIFALTRSLTAPLVLTGIIIRKMRGFI